MSQPSRDEKNLTDDEDQAARRGQTVQMNPALLGQAVNMNPGSTAVQHLDAAAALLENSQDDAISADLTIEQYMADLIARSRAPRQDAEMQSAVTTQIPLTAQPVAEPAVVVNDEVAEAPRRQTGAPECRDAISELRELANISARSSFNVHRAQQLVYQMHNKLAVTLVALVVSFALTNLAGHSQSPTFFTAVIALIVAMAWAVKYFKLARQLKRLCGHGAESID